MGDELDVQTVFAEKRPATSRGSASKGLKSDIVVKVCTHSRALVGFIIEFYDQTNFMGLASIIHNLLLPFKLRGQSAQVTKVAVDK